MAASAPRRDAGCDGHLRRDTVWRPPTQTASLDCRLDDTGSDKRLERLPDLPAASRQKFAQLGLSYLRASRRVEPGQQGEKGGQREAGEAHGGHALEAFRREVNRVPLVSHGRLERTPIREVKLCVPDMRESQKA